MRKIGALVVLSLIAVSPMLHAQGRITPPRLINLPAPDCKPGKACHGRRGSVRLVINVQEDGQPGDIRVELGSGVLVEAATAAAQKAEFAPGSISGKPAPMDYVLTLHY